MTLKTLKNNYHNSLNNALFFQENRGTASDFQIGIK